MSPSVTMNVASLPGLERADAVGDAEEPRGLERHGRDRLLAGEAEGDGRRRVCGRLRTFERVPPPSLKSTRTPALGEHARVGELGVVGSSSRCGSSSGESTMTGHVRLRELVGHAPGVGAPPDHEAQLLLLGPRHGVADLGERAARRRRRGSGPRAPAARAASFGSASCRGMPALPSAAAGLRVGARVAEGVLQLLDGLVPLLLLRLDGAARRRRAVDREVRPEDRDRGRARAASRPRASSRPASSRPRSPR